MLAPACTDTTAKPAHQTNAASAGAPNIIAMLLEALMCPDRYEIVERDGELFVKPIV